MKEFEIANTTDKYDYSFQVIAEAPHYKIVTLDVGLHEEAIVAIKMFNHALLCALKDFSVDTSLVTFDSEGSAFYEGKRFSHSEIMTVAGRGYTHIPAIVHLMMIKEGIDPEKFTISFKNHIEDLI